MSRDKLLIVGDVHGEFDYLEDLIESTPCFAVIVAGDFGFWKAPPFAPHPNGQQFIHQYYDFEVPVYFVDGNHEDHNSLEQLVEIHGKNSPIDIGSNCWYIPRGCVFQLTNPVTNKTISILGLGGAYSIDKHLRVANVSWFEQEQLRHKDIIDLQPRDDIDIIVSHTCPEVILKRVAKTCNIPYNRIIERQTEKLLDGVFDIIKPKRWVFGHWHQVAQYRAKGTTFNLLNMANRDGWYRLLKV